MKSLSSFRPFRMQWRCGAEVFLNMVLEMTLHELRKANLICFYLNSTSVANWRAMVNVYLRCGVSLPSRVLFSVTTTTLLSETATPLCHFHIAFMTSPHQFLSPLHHYIHHFLSAPHHITSLIARTSRVSTVYLLFASVLIPYTNTTLLYTESSLARPRSVCCSVSGGHSVVLARVVLTCWGSGLTQQYWG